MGYFEHLCQLCAVSFAIARIRTVNEPPEAAWDYYGENFVDFGLDLCQPISESGCSSVDRNGTEEHIAGPGCHMPRGYSGANITLLEMKGCRDVRGLCMKPADGLHDFQPEDDDEPWERDSKYFFTGVGNGSPDEAALDNFDKVRHGVRSICIGNISYGYMPDYEEAIPVHPTCWEIFKRVSEHTQGFVDVHGFWKFRSLNNSYGEFHERFPRHPVVRNGFEQWWNHEAGSEWLVANPINIPGMAAYLKPATGLRSEFRDDAFWKSKRKELPTAATTTTSDPFSKLPTELRLMIQELLPSKAIANLRAASRAMKPVPTVIFRRLLLEDMPWFWEVRDLPIEKTDWFRLYKRVKFVWIEIKGAKNRARIWKEVTEICRRIQNYREDGMIRGRTGWEEDADVVAGE